MRGEFDLDPGLIYLNSGSHSICPRPVVDALLREEREFERNPTFGLFSSKERLWVVQKELAGFLGASVHDLFLRQNVTQALNVFILGVPMPAGGEFVVSDLEYGAVVNICRYRAERDGRKLRTLGLPARREELEGMAPEDFVRRIVAELRPETRMLLLSHVMTANGLVMPIREIARETRKRGILFVVDGAHGPGSLPLDFTQLGDVDFYGGNLHKWAMGPKGTAFGWVSPRHQEALMPGEIGWTTFEIPAAFKGFGEGNLFQARFAISGSANFAPFYALSETFAFWRRHAPGKIFERLDRLQRHAESEAGRLLGWPSLSPPHGGLRGPLLSYRAPDAIAAEGYEFNFRLLREKKVQISMPVIHGRPGLRLSPHVYNTEEEITRGVEAVAQAAARAG